MNAPELAKYINERIVGPQKESDKPLTESAILTALRKNCPLCGGNGLTPMRKCGYCFINLGSEDVPDNNTKRSTTRKKISPRK